MLQLLGSPAFSFFRKNKLLQTLQAIDPDIMEISAHFMHLVHTPDLSASELELLQRLLHYGPRIEQEQIQGTAIFVLPRFGTQSPWSSKATDIAHNCGLDQIERLERGIEFRINFSKAKSQEQLNPILDQLHDPMTQSICFAPTELEQIFTQHSAKPLQFIPLLEQGITALHAADRELGLALSPDEIEYLHTSYQELQRDPSDVELMMFAQANSEHCRHKIFNADWVIDGAEKTESLFAMIRHTHECQDNQVLSAYKDNAAVMQGYSAEKLFINPADQNYQYKTTQRNFLAKVETHNHPTAISPYPGAATGSGGEIRDEGATGRGSKPKVGLTGFSVSNLKIPNYTHAWEIDNSKPARICSALDIMLDGPIGAAAFNNEFGRPNICGYFRSFEHRFQQDDPNKVLGYHKPIMIAGGLGNIDPDHVLKDEIPADSLIIVLGGPAMEIGLGGGAASSMSQGASQEKLDFASVQRDNAEIERRCQEVIDACCAMQTNPIISIHDVGAGGLSNALPELMHDSDRGGEFELRNIPNAEPGMSPLAIWCNEAQERYVLAIAKSSLTEFNQIAERERCPYAVVGKSLQEEHLTVSDAKFANNPVDLPMSVLFGKPPKMLRNVKSSAAPIDDFDAKQINLTDAIERVLQLPCVADKSFLITIGDRSVTGLVSRDQMVGPWQVPVADVAVSTNSLTGFTGEAMAMGERTPVAILNPAASGRLAVGEAITNLASAPVEHLNNVILSANWMAACGQEGQDAALYATVEAVGKELCPELGITIPVGKDSLSMCTKWQENSEQRSVSSPLSLIISAFAPVNDVRGTLTPELQLNSGETSLLLLDLGQGQARMGGSALAQVYNKLGKTTPDLDQAELLKNFFNLIQALNKENLILSYHDRSDGGLLVTLCEMAFASHSGLQIQLENLSGSVNSILFNEELGAVIQVKTSELNQIMAMTKSFALEHCCHLVATPNDSQTIEIYQQDQKLYTNSRVALQQLWSKTSYHMQALRDNPECAEQEYARISDADDPGLHSHLSFDIQQLSNYAKPAQQPKVAILREQGVNGHYEMAAAFYQAGFRPIDVHMSDLLAGKVSLTEFVGLAACGGFSYGDVLGAGEGWAKSILYHENVRNEFANFFQRPDTFTLGVCNGCQMLANLREIIPGTEHWPHFVRNRSEQYEARLVMVEVQSSPSIFFKDMQGSRIPVVVAHGEGRAQWPNAEAVANADQSGLVSLRFTDNYAKVTETFPANPNGSPLGITGLTNTDGRVTILMPHPERVFRTNQLSWHPQDWPEYSPWLKMFINAREFVG